MIAGCARLFSFSQRLDRPALYGVSVRLQTIPSRPNLQACSKMVARLHDQEIGRRQAVVFDIYNLAGVRARVQEQHVLAAIVGEVSRCDDCVC